MGWKAVEPRNALEHEGNIIPCRTIRVNRQYKRHAVSCHRSAARCVFTSCGMARVLLDAAPAMRVLFIEFRRWRVFLPLFPAMPGGCRPDNFTSIKEREGTGGCGPQVQTDGAGGSSPEEKPEESGRRASAPDRAPGSLI
ncbi:hypothetical protein [Nitrosospira multiformis]|uniref:hypothetical protein n=1 Tax=Nitrosospira multiformis TaxID=1231 RepID=UPI00089B8896|nr:hypothetical protein [Nitrosospira multiformis]SEA44481.1 hypothetical protein SAMN05216411_10978 [Nitrosospira multiformis]